MPISVEDKDAQIDMTILAAEYWLWAIVGAVVGAGVTFLTQRSKWTQRAVAVKTSGQASDRVLESQRAWEAFAASALKLIPVVNRQLQAVTQQTEQAAMDLAVHLRALASGTGNAKDHEQVGHQSRAVMAMQFQDITRQKLDHVAHALSQLQRHLQALLRGSLDDDVRREIAVLEGLEQSYTMEEERRIHAATTNPDYQEPIPTDAESSEAESVTLF